MKRRHIQPTNLPLLKLAYAIYGKRFVRKTIRLVDDRTLANITPPYILLANHCSFADVACIVSMLLPDIGAGYIASNTQYSKFGSILSQLGVICKKQFVVDAGIVRDIKYVLDCNRPIVIYPEGKLSVDGTTNPIPVATAKLIKLLKTTVVTVQFDGSYLAKPRWARDYRCVRVVPTVKVALTQQEVVNCSVQQIHDQIVSNLQYDDYKYQRDNSIVIGSKRLVEGLEDILFECAECGSIGGMTAKGNRLICNKCNSTATMDEYGQLRGVRYSTVPQWYEDIKTHMHLFLDDGNYNLEESCRIEKLTKNRFVKAGSGIVTHSRQGIVLTGKHIAEHWAGGLFYTLSFDSRFVYLPTKDAIYRIRLDQGYKHTLMNIMTELIYKQHQSAVK